jgi:hypothetical protein
MVSNTRNKIHPPPPQRHHEPQGRDPVAFPVPIKFSSHHGMPLLMFQDAINS